MMDNIYEGDEMFNMNLSVSHLLSPEIIADLTTNANGLIIDSTGM